MIIRQGFEDAPLAAGTLSMHSRTASRTCKLTALFAEAPSLFFVNYEYKNRPTTFIELSCSALQAPPTAFLLFSFKHDNFQRTKPAFGRMHRHPSDSQSQATKRMETTLQKVYQITAHARDH